MKKDELTLLGRVSGQIELIIKRQDTVIQDVARLFKGQGEIKDALAALDCKDEERRLVKVEETLAPLEQQFNQFKTWKDACTAKEETDKATDLAVNIERRKSPITLRHAIYVALISASCSGSIAIGVAVITHFWK